MSKIVPSFHLQKVKDFALICIVVYNKVEPEQRFARLQNLEKFGLLANENITTFFKLHTYRLWWRVLPISILKKGKNFGFNLHHIQDMYTGH